MKKIIIVLLTIIPLIMNSQDKNLPFSEIGDYPTEYTPVSYTHLTLPTTD
mgnify:CR=1 FL=1